MKLKGEFEIKEIAGYYCAVSVNDSCDFVGFIRLNSTGKFLFELLKNEITREDMEKEMINKYKVDKELVQEEVDKFIRILSEKNILVG